MSVEYDRYLNQHISMVGTGLRWMTDNLDLKKLGFDDYDISWAMDHGSIHDQSKSDSEEYGSYDAYFYGGNRSHQVVKDFTYAWLRHLKFNPHHWQYWILINDDPDDEFKDRSYEERYGINVAMEIPKCYILEMIADWWTFSWRNKNLMEIFSWYDKHRNYIVMHSHSRKLVEAVLDAMEEKLYTQSDISHGDLDDEDKHKYGVPEQKKFPMPDARHVKSAIKFFNYVDPKYEQELADAILARMKEYGLVLGDDISVGDENRFKKYIPEEKEKENADG